MRTIYLTTSLFFVMCFSQIQAQDQIYRIPLSNPGAPGSLEIDVYNPAITITGYAGDDVELVMTDKRLKAGRRISAPDFLYHIIEEDNKVSITRRNETSPRIKGLALELKVPHQFDLKIYTYFGPFVKISGTTGEIEVEGYFTDLDLQDLQSNVIASTNQGKLSAKFDRISDDSTIFISNYNGPLEISLPAQAKATLLMDNYFGKFKSDFTLGIDTRANKKDEGEFIWRTINGGGAELKLVNYYKDIFIRSH